MSVHPATTAEIVSSILNQSSPDLEHTFPYHHKENICGQSQIWVWSIDVNKYDLT